MDITNQAVKDWLEDIDDAKKREKDFRKNGDTILDIYNGDDPDKVPFNILYSNTETLMPALYSQTPRPVVKRRFNQEVSPIVKAVEQAGTRILEYFLDTNIDGYEDFDDVMTDAVQDGALPGRGVTQIKFDAVVEESGELEKKEDGEEVETEEELKWAFVCTESKHWKKVHFGQAKKWSKMPWVAFEDYLDREECDELFTSEMAANITFTENEEDDDTDRKGDKNPRKTAIIYQIWNKSDKSVKWISETHDGFLKEQEDPLGITGFFPMPKPLMFHRKSNDLMPTPLYALYENQAKELNRITQRLNKVVEAIKVRGVYDGALGDELEEVFEEADNAFVPTDKGASLVEGGFDKAFWMMPIDKLIAVAQSLIQAREEIKSVIYEITGLSDVIRGQSKASETLGAQKIKESWGTMRLKNQQKVTQKYARDTLRIMLDVASQKVPLRFWGDLTGLSYPTAEQKEKAQAQLQAMKAQVQVQMQEQQVQAQQAQQMGQQVPPPKSPPPPPQELMEMAQKPSWEEILAILKDDFIRSYKIDIETNSTLDIEATEDQKQVSEFMNAMAQFMNGTMPMVKEKVLPFGAAKAMFLEIARRFRFGIDVEDQIKKMEEPKGPDPEQIKKQGEEFKKKTMELQKKEKTFEEQKQQAGEKLDQKMRDIQKKEMEFDFKQQLFEAKQKMTEQFATEKLKLKETGIMNEIDNQRTKSQNAMTKETEKVKRDIQGMLDKATSVISKSLEQPKAQEG